MKTYRAGVIGLGLMGQRMLRSLEHHPRFDITQVFDSDAARVSTAVAHHATAQPAENAAEVTSHGSVDLVYIATPPSTHVDYALASLEAGKAVFCEKPLAVSVAEGERLVARAEASGLANAVNFPFATLNGLERVEEPLAAGKAGELERLDIALHFSQWPRNWQSAGPWLAERHEGGFVREVFSHFVYLTHRLLGAPLEIRNCELDYPPGGELSETHVCSRLDCAGVPVFLTGGHGGAAPDLCEWTLYGRNHSFRLQNWSILLGGTRSEWRLLVPEDPDPAPPGSRQLDALAQHLDGQPSRLPSLADAFEVQRVVEALLARGGQAV